MGQYIKFIPKTLQEDFVENRVVPFIGAGFSRNANVTDNTTLPDWEELGKAIAKYIPNYDFQNTIDALSLFETEFSRTKLIEIIAKELKINSAKPGLAHRAFCDLNFDTICTTNFDFLIEQSLNEKSTPFSTIISEDRLPISIHEKTKLIKLHGDFNHPERMVITENDYDNFLDKNKVLATYISNIFITKTLLLVGYSLDDYDIRTLWKIIGSRLGQLQIPAYVVLVGASTIEISRFERRNIKVINLPGEKKDYEIILQNFFNDIKDLINSKGPDKIIVTNEKAFEELKMPVNDSKLCFISAPAKRIARLKQLLYPILSKNGVTPITLDEVIMAGDLWTRKVDLIINQCFMSIVDVSDNNANVMWELGNLTAKNKRILLLVDKECQNNIHFNLLNMSYITYSLIEDDEEFSSIINNEIKDIVKQRNENEKEYFRLIEKGEYDAAVISVYRHLEITITRKFGENKNALSIIGYLKLLNSNNKHNRELLVRAKEYLNVRNRIVHMDISVKKKESLDIVNCVDELCNAIERDEIIIL